MHVRPAVPTLLRYWKKQILTGADSISFRLVFYHLNESYYMNRALSQHTENDKKLCLKAKNKLFFEKSIARKLTNESWLGNIDSRSNHLFILISLLFLPMAQDGFPEITITWLVSSPEDVNENLYKRLNFLIRPTKSRRNHSSNTFVHGRVLNHFWSYN